MISPLYAANNIIRKANSQAISITNLKMQKLLYVLYAKYITKSPDFPLFPDRFEAWQYGPVLTKVYDIFKIEGAAPIRNMRPDSNGEVLIVSEEGIFGECFDYVWLNYARCTAAELVNLTHGRLHSHVPEYISAWQRALDKNGLGSFIDDEHIKKDGEVWFA